MELIGSPMDDIHPRHEGDKLCSTQDPDPCGLGTLRKVDGVVSPALAADGPQSWTAPFAVPRTYDLVGRVVTVRHFLHGQGPQLPEHSPEFTLCIYMHQSAPFYN